MSREHTPGFIAVQDLIVNVPQLEAHRALLSDLLSTFPVPHFLSTRLLVQALDRVRSEVEWLHDSEISWFSPGWSTFVSLFKTVRLPEQIGDFYRADDLKNLTEKYPFYSALLSPGNAPKGVEQLRAVLVLCRFHWTRSPADGLGKIVALTTLSRAIRGATLRRRSDFSEWVATLGGAQSLEELIRRADGAHASAHEGLKEQWPSKFVPELRGHQQLPSQTEYGKNEGGEAEEGTSTLTAGRRTKARTIFGGDKPALEVPRERGEPVEDVQEPVLGVEVLGSGRTFASKRVNIFRATQAVWSQNHLQLMEHPESLLLHEAQALAGFLIQELEASIFAEQLDQARSLAWLMLSLATGRSSQSLSAIRILKTLSEKKPAPARWDLGMAEGVVRQPVLRPIDPFVPSREEQPFLEGTLEVILLRFPRNVLAALGRVRRCGVVFAGCTVERIKLDLALAARHAAKHLGLAITPGRVRRVIANALQDTGRNLPATMLITGDTLGRSTAPLYYYAPRQRDLADTYAKASTRIFSPELESSRVPMRSEMRVGSRLLATQKHIRAMSRALGTASHGGLANRSDARSLSILHNSLVDQVAGMLIGVAGHRPDDALFLLTRGDVDLRRGIAVFSDKRVDPAHWTRFAALAPVLIDQLSRFFEHLAGLRGRSPRPLAGYLSRVLEGKEAFLFLLDEAWGRKPLTIKQWRTRLPRIWTRLPLNLSRTHIYTRGIENGCRPEALSAQLGHLDALGYPFGDDGPTEPILLAKEIAPHLEKLARDAGWVARHGCRPSVPVDFWQHAGPLKNWNNAVRSHEAQTREAVKAARASRNAQRRAARVPSEARVSELLSEQTPLLANALRENRAKEGVALESLDVAQVEELQYKLSNEVDGEPVATMARYNALARALGWAKKSLRWSGFVPSGWIVPHRDITSPFFPGMTLAGEQVEALRDLYHEGLATHATHAVTDRHLAFARTAFALTLFGFVECEEEVLGILSARNGIRRCASIPDLVLVEWSSEPRKVAGLRGLAAIAIARLRKSHPSGDRPTLDEINAALLLLLPAQVIGTLANPLGRLCSTTRVSNRMELSGAALLALDPNRGSVSAPVEQQLSWLDRDPVIPGSGKPAEPITRSVAPPKSYRRGKAQEQYRQLLKVFPSTLRTTILPRTKTEISAADVERGRQRIIAELDHWENDPETNNVVAALAHWASRMLRVGTVAETNPANSTVHSYLTAVGSTLVTLAANIFLNELDEAELSQLYLDVVEAKVWPARPLTARELMNFHAAVGEPFGLEPIDESELAAYAPVTRRSVDAELITPTQCDWALNFLQRQGDFDLQPTGTLGLAAVRLHRQARMLLEFQIDSGSRFGEAVGMRFRDIYMQNERAVVRYATNRNRRVKNTQSNRRVDISHRRAPEQRAETCKWLAAEREWIGEDHARFAYLYCGTQSHKDLLAKPALRAIVGSSLALATGRPSERDHRVRHCAAGEGLLCVFLSARDRQSVKWLKPLAPEVRLADCIAFPRDLHRQSRVLGQSTPITTIKSYFHHPWALRSRADNWLSSRMDRSAGATALQISVAGVDRISQRHKPTEPTIAWLDHVIPPRASPMNLAAITPPVVGSKRVLLTTEEIGRILGWTRCGVTAESAALSAGAGQRGLDELRAAALEYAARVGRGFLKSEEASSSKAGARAIREVRLGEHLNALLNIADRAAGDKQRDDLVSVSIAHFAWARASNAHTLYLPMRESDSLMQLLETIGHPPSLVERTQQKDLLMAIEVLRPGVRGRFLGRPLKKILGIVWIASRLQQHHR